MAWEGKISAHDRTLEEGRDAYQLDVINVLLLVGLLDGGPGLAVGHLLHAELVEHGMGAIDIALGRLVTLALAELADLGTAVRAVGSAMTFDTTGVARAGELALDARVGAISLEQVSSVCNLRNLRRLTLLWPTSPQLKHSPVFGGLSGQSRAKWPSAPQLRSQSASSAMGDNEDTY